VRRRWAQQKQKPKDDTINSNYKAFFQPFVKRNEVNEYGVGEMNGREEVNESILANTARRIDFLIRTNTPVSFIHLLSGHLPLSTVQGLLCPFQRRTSVLQAIFEWKSSLLWRYMGAICSHLSVDMIVLHTLTLRHTLISAFYASRY
jgi:hypothetical protein